MPDSQSNGLHETSHALVPALPRRPQSADPCAFVVFGAAGDLTKRLIVPALYNLACSNILPENFALIGVDPAAGTTRSWPGGRVETRSERKP